ncbi:MAG: hypothetical protein IPJ07_20575 [Acidobacteria bacterium]|nr:hypothetical protein [Acidobacteriota bacterium]
MRIAIPRTLHLRLSVCVLLLAIAAAAFISNDKAAQAQENKGQITDATFKTLQFRSIGPAIMGGRIDDFAVVEASPLRSMLVNRIGWFYGRRSTTGRRRILFSTIRKSVRSAM